MTSIVSDIATARYSADGNWYKGNTHIHSTVSDGGWTFAELETAYGGAGYDFLCRTDHWVASRVREEGDASGGSLIWLDGVELDGYDDRGSYYHVVCLGEFTGIGREMGFPAALNAVRIQGGLLILAHPFWTGNSFDEAERWSFHGVEIYNHVCQWLNGKGDGRAYWQALLGNAPGLPGFACDDAHTTGSHPGWNGGWVMVQAEALTTEAIVSSLRAGRFYSSTGPTFRSIVCDGTSVTATTSPVQFARLVGPGPRGRRMGTFDGTLIDHIAFEIPADWPYAYLEIEDNQGRRAWTNTLHLGRAEG